MKEISISHSLVFAQLNSFSFYFWSLHVIIRDYLYRVYIDLYKEMKEISITVKHAVGL